MSKSKPEPPINADDPEQSRRFIDMAREIGVDEDPEAFDRAFKKVVTVISNPPDQS
jgi:hypothetical protein